ncbi:hypothetical protein [Chryseobacterium lathyri]|jgi:hypothetical protein|nr:hypothetical protein [Chryseobacterium lathyri]
MRKNLFLRLFLLIALGTLLYSCRTEEELNPKNSEAGNLQYGISKEAFMGSLFVTGLKSSSSKNVASALTAEELVERLDLEKAHLNSGNGKEVFHVPVRTFGSYKRSLLSISGNGNSIAVLLTYPNPEDYRLFYITDLNGNLLKEVKIGDNGKELPTSPNSKESGMASKSGDVCEEVVYETCSSGQHSFETGNAYQCEFWNNLQGGTPPKLFKINGICGDTGSGGGGTTIGGDGSSGGHSAGGSGTSPVGGGGPPKYDFSSADCVQNLDCENCNIPGDTNNDCKLSYDEAIAFNNNPCEKTKSMLTKPNVQQGINNIKAQALATLSNVNAGEIGFKEKKDGTLAPADVNSAHQVVFNDVTDSYGGYHNHTATGTHMFSPPDIVDALFGFATAQNIQDGVGNAYLGMIAGEWCNTCPNNVQYIHYVIQYTGAAAELGGYVYTEAQMKQFEKDYRKKVNKLLKDPLNSNNNGATLNNVGLEKLFFDTLKNIGIDGKVNLQRIESNGTINNVTLNSNGSINANPCP